MPLRYSLRYLPLIVMMFLAGCRDAGSGSSAGDGAGADGEKTLTIAVIPKGTTHDFWKSVHAGAAQAAQELGNVEIIWKGTLNEKDKEGQINLVQGFVVDRVDGICLAPIDRDALVPVVKRAGRQDIPVVIFDSGLTGEENYISYVATDNYHGGTLAAEHLAKLLNEEGDVILIRYQEGSESTEQREAGFLDAIKKYPNINILTESQRVSSDAEQALQITASLLVAHQDRVDGIFTVCEPINKGALQALKNKNMAGQVKFIGFDSDPRFVEALRNDEMHGIVLQDPVRMGYLAVKTMVEHLRGQPVETRIVTGEYLATAENMEDERIHELLHPTTFTE